MITPGVARNCILFQLVLALNLLAQANSSQNAGGQWVFVEGEDVMSGQRSDHFTLSGRYLDGSLFRPSIDVVCSNGRYRTWLFLTDRVVGRSNMNSLLGAAEIFVVTRVNSDKPNKMAHWKIAQDYKTLFGNPKETA